MRARIGEARSGQDRRKTEGGGGLWAVPRGQPCLLFPFSFSKNLSELILMERLPL